MNETAKRLFLAVFIFAVLGAALVLIFRQRGSNEEKIPTEKGVATIGTFNIAWLGDGENDRIKRSEDDYKRIAEIILQGNPDILAVQEVENPAALKKILRYMDGYKFFLGEHGHQQNVGVIYKNSLNVQSEGEYLPIAVNPERNRPGFLVRCKKENFDWVMMVVHFKSTSRYDSTAELREQAREMRTKQAEITAQWANYVISATNEKDVIILGDFNDFPRRKKDNSLAAFLANPQLEFLTYDTRSCAKGFLYAIDQIVVSKSAKNRFQERSLQMLNFRNSLPDEQADMVSDHCPVFARFSTMAPDND